MDGQPASSFTKKTTQSIVHNRPRVTVLPRSSVMYSPYSAHTMDTRRNGEVQKDPSSAKRASPARWDPGGLWEHPVVAGLDGRGFGGAGPGRPGGHQDLRVRKGLLVRAVDLLGSWATGLLQSPALLGLTHTQLLQQALVLWLSFQHFQQIGRLHPLKLHLPVHIDLLVERDIHKAGAVVVLFAGIQAWEVWVVRKSSRSSSPSFGGHRPDGALVSAVSTLPDVNQKTTGPLSTSPVRNSVKQVQQYSIWPIPDTEKPHNRSQAESHPRR